MADIMKKLEAARWGMHLTGSNRRLSDRASSVERHGGDTSGFVQRNEFAISEAMHIVAAARALLRDDNFETRSN